MGHYILEFVVVCVAAFLGSYLREKGKNQATKEDIGEITKKVEDIKLQNNKILAWGEWRNQLRLAAIERRLDAHQQAYLLLERLSGIISINETEHEKLLKECRVWWNNNNLFLTVESRDAFNRAWEEASAILELRLMARVVEAGSREDIDRKKEIMRRNQIITSAIATILSEVEFPSMALDSPPLLKP